MRPKQRISPITIAPLFCVVSFVAGLLYLHYSGDYDSLSIAVNDLFDNEPVSDEDFPGQKSGIVGCPLDPAMGQAGWVISNRKFLRHYPKYAKSLKANWTHLPNEVWKGIVPD